MTHEGRMARGKQNFDSNKLLDNADTLYYLDNKPKPVIIEEVKEEIKEEIVKEKKEKKHESRK